MIYCEIFRRIYPLDSEGLDDCLQRAVAKTRETYPDLEIDPAEFIAYIGNVALAHELSLGDIDSMHHDHLWLSCACLRGDPLAAKKFEETLAATVAKVASRLGLSKSDADDLFQEIAEHVLLPPKQSLRQYAGKGPLEGWLRVVVARTAIAARKMEAKHRRTLSNDLSDFLLETAIESDRAALKAEYRDSFRAAFKSAVSKLSSRERLILRYTLDGASAAEIAQVMNVHRVTVARWLSSTRKSIYRTVHRAMHQVAGADSDELHSIERVLVESVSVSLHRLLHRDSWSTIG